MSNSELRRDVVSKDWVAVATGRARRPQFRKKHPVVRDSVAKCPFQELPETLVLYSLDGDKDIKPAGRRHPGPEEIWGVPWWVRVVKNLYPAFEKGDCVARHARGPYYWMEGVGFHEVVITKDHERSLAQMSKEEAELVIRAYQDRYLALKNEECVRYVSVFHNHGPEAGASVSHPHSQIIAIPVIPPDVYRSFEGSRRYWEKEKKCVHCVVIEYEKKAGERVVYENDDFLVVAPFASKTAFETRIFPKAHNANFESITPGERVSLADALRLVLSKIFRILGDPDYNFFIHTAPVSEEQSGFGHYHWHLEILPKTAIWAGFEIGTGIEISTVAPEQAAEILRKNKVL